ncbi:MAG: S41 family peptidase [Christensenellales bacterium]|jgi:carboxyl-terminal processing protease
MKKRTAAILCVVVAAVCSVVTCYCTLYAVNGNLSVPREENTAEAWAPLKVIREIDGKIEGTSIYPFDEDTRQTMEHNAVKGYLTGLGDPYAVWFTKEEFEEYMEASAGNYVGIGVLVQFDTEANHVRAVRVYEDSPAFEAGILAGDLFMEVDGQDVTGMSLDDVKNLVAGVEGTEVTITLSRNDAPYTVTCIRRALTVTRVYAQMASDRVGYISISEFYGDADKAFKTAYENLRGQGMEALIVDLRDNPGGEEGVVVNIADYFMEKGPVIITEDKDGNRDIGYSTHDPIVDVPVAVLVNGNSASASELLTANLKDLGIATVIGTRTFGKGTVQTFQYLSNGSVVKLTAFRYLTGQETPVQDVGVEPDIVTEAEADVSMNYMLRTTDADNQYQTAIIELERQLREGK